MTSDEKRGRVGGLCGMLGLIVLASAGAVFAARGEDGAAPGAAGASAEDAEKSWVDGRVTVTAGSRPVRYQQFETAIPAGVSAVWDALTTAEGMRKVISPDAKIELRLGGPYEIFAGSGATVQAFIPRELLAVTGSAPMEFPNVRMGGTWAIFEFDAVNPEMTVVRMSILGWREGEEWERAYEYFLRNNAMFMNLLRQRFVEGPLKWSEAPAGEHPTYTRVPLAEEEADAGRESERPLPGGRGADGRQLGAGGRLDKVVLLDAAPADVWRALATEAGLKGWLASAAKVELEIGGAYEIEYRPDVPPGSAGMEGTRVLSFFPERMLALEGRDVPPRFPDAAPSMTWVVWRLTPADDGRTRLRFTSLGWGEGEEWEAARAAFDHKMDVLLTRLGEGKVRSEE